ncbi:PDZ and LIM domain protein 2-like isoform X1 [Centruroides vittatus]|uniref:PDZ and LIM domain protein 2-like isoform X1 n=1 Tax=Centruroides vittatus TaxID=120091 RepID=UPI0035108CA7
MAGGIVTVELARDGQGTPWGFRLHGGKDVGYPLSVQRVFLGSPSEGEIHRGDIILMIGNTDARNLTHQQATDIFRKAGNNLKLVIQRSKLATSGSSTPINSPFGSTPFLNLSGGPVTMYHLASPPSAGSTPPPPLTKPLPTTQFTDNYRPYTPDSQLTDEDSQEYLVEKHRERQSIVNQAHRTFPLITPQAKPRHDLPTGSYLRFVNDPNWKTSPSNQAMVNKVTESLIMAKLQDNLRSTDSPGSSYSPGRTPTPESLPTSGPKVLHKQYNSPINLYSAEAITETLVGQASIQHNQTNTSVAEQPLPSPLIYTSLSIKRSPTYQMLHHQEWGNLKKSEMKEHGAVENKVYSIPFGEGKFGHGKDVIHQSGSFKNLMTNIAQSSV